LCLFDVPVFHLLIHWLTGELVVVIKVAKAEKLARGAQLERPVASMRRFILRRVRRGEVRAMKLPARYGTLLATSSAVALLGQGSAASAACYTGPLPFTNNAVQSCIQVTNTSFSGYVTNNAVISPGGISVTNSTITGGIADNGTTLAGGITVDTRSRIIGVGSITAIVVSQSTFSGGISQAGTVTSGGSGVSVGGASTFAGGITNSGSVTAGFNGVVVFGASAFSGGILNSGSISAPSGIGMLAAFVSTFSGGITNTGTITAAAGILAGYPGFAVTTFSGSLINRGKITASQTGIGVFSISTFTGGVTNSGTITAGDAGIVVGDATLTRLRRTGVNLIGASPSAVTIPGGILNSGSIVASTGILVGGGSDISGGITNSGSITGSRAAIDVTGEGAATTINQAGGTINGPILLSALGDTVNISGGTVAGNIVGPGASGTINFALGAGNTFTYAAPFGFSGVNQVNINSGSVVLDGVNSASAIAVNSGGTLAGTGTVNAPVTINSGGAFSPGTPGVPGTSMTIGGNLAFQSGALYVIYLNSSTSSLANVTGTVTLAGTVQANVSSASTKTYLILHSAGIDPTTFNGLVLSNPNYRGVLSYSATDVFLNLTSGLGAGTTLNVNQQNTANAINNFFNSGGTLPPGFANLFNLTGANLGNALTQLDGENASGAERSAFDLMNGFMSLMLDPHVPISCDPRDVNDQLCRELRAIGFAPEQTASLPPDLALAYNAVFKAPPKPVLIFQQRWTAWAAGFGGGATANGNPIIGSNNVRTGTFGYAAGMDYLLSPGTVLGFALAGGGTSWNLAQGLGTGRSDAFLAGLYGVTHQGPAYLAGTLAFANNWFTTDRTALGDQLTASFQGQSYAARLEGGYRFAVPAAYNAIGVTPYAAIQAQNFRTPNYSETDLTGGGFGISYASMNGTDTRSELGARIDDSTLLGNMPLILRGNLAWAHDWVSNPTLNASFESLPGTSFTVFGAPIPHDSALTGVSAQLFFRQNWSFLVKFNGDFASGSQTYAGTGTLRYTW
jgi:hypothetical protein